MLLNRDFDQIAFHSDDAAFVVSVPCDSRPAADGESGLPELIGELIYIFPASNGKSDMVIAREAA